MRPHSSQGVPATLRAAILLALHLCSSPAKAADIESDPPVSTEGKDDGKSYYTALHPCPAACLGPSSNWTVYNSYGRLRRCDEPMLLSFSLLNPVEDDSTPTKINTCTSGDADTTVNSLFNGTNAGVDRPPSEAARTTPSSSGKRQAAPGGDNNCPSATARAAPTETMLAIELVVGGADPNPGDKRNKAAEMALAKLQAHFGDGGGAPCEEAAMFAYYRGVAAGVYIGSSFGRNTVATVVKPLLEQVQAGSQTTFAAQLCGEGRNAHHVLGLVVDTADNMTVVQEAVRGWNEAKCLTTLESRTELEDVPVWEDRRGLGPFENVTAGGNGTAMANSTFISPSGLARRFDCTTQTVVSGDTCASLASRCGLSGVAFTKYNSVENLRSTLVPGQRVCCSIGLLPDIRPKANPDGTCATHLVVSGDTCSYLAASNGITVGDIEEFNKGTTWGWYGCDRLLASMYICLSTGDPPLPFPISNTQCGPTKPETQKPGPGVKLKDLNPCPLNACCNVWGQCGITSDFCTVKESSSGNPGTSGLQNGCVSSCGMDIISSSKPPASFGRIGYYESWNFGGPCLHQFADNANTVSSLSPSLSLPPNPSMSLNRLSDQGMKID